MANPSLQIGNDNWAIKEDNLLGYSTAGTRFVPQPITMTRASAGTRVNPQGLVEDVELLGSELVTCGDFSCAVPTDYWNTIGDSTITSTGNIISTSGSVSGISQTNILEIGKNYKLIYTISNYVSGGLKVAGTQIPSNLGSNNYYFTASATSLEILRNSGITNISISNVSVKESTKNNLARVDYTDGTSSLLAEPQRTNLVTYSEDFSVWSGLIALSIGLNQGVSPNGLTEANLLSVGIDVSATRHRLYNLFSFVSGDTYTFSVFAKKNEQDWFQLMFSSTAFDAQSYANFDLNNGVVGNTGTSTTANIIDYGSGWYRCSITCTATASINTTYEVLATNNTDSGRYPSYQSDSNVDVCYLWGGQLEEGSYATSYIPTSGSTVSRVQDQYSKTGISSLINSTEGVLFVEMALLNNTGNYKSLSISDGTTDNRVTFENRPVLNQIKAFVNVSGTNVMSSTQTLTDVKEFNKMALKWKQNDFAWWVNGVEIYTDTSGNTFSADTLNRLAFDRGDGFIQLEGKVKKLQVFKTALTDTELATLTTI